LYGPWLPSIPVKCSSRIAPTKAADANTLVLFLSVPKVKLVDRPCTFLLKFRNWVLWFSRNTSPALKLQRSLKVPWRHYQTDLVLGIPPSCSGILLSCKEARRLTFSDNLPVICKSRLEFKTVFCCCLWWHRE
jgi:hypothetical protein